MSLPRSSCPLPWPCLAQRPRWLRRSLRPGGHHHGCVGVCLPPPATERVFSPAGAAPPWAQPCGGRRDPFCAAAMCCCARRPNSHRPRLRRRPRQPCCVGFGVVVDASAGKKSGGRSQPRERAGVSRGLQGKKSWASGHVLAPFADFVPDKGIRDWGRQHLKTGRGQVKKGWSVPKVLRQG